MTPIQLASLFNLLGLLVVLLVSVFVDLRYPNPFFSRWLRAYFGISAIVALEFVATFTGRTLLLDEAVFVAGAEATWFLVATARMLHGKQTPFSRWWPLLVLPPVIATGLRLAGHPFSEAVLAALLPYVGAFFFLAWHLITHRAQSDGGRGWLLGVPVSCIGLWMLLYPVVHGSPLQWVGYAVAAMLQIFVGIGMVVYLLDESTRQLKIQNARLQEIDTIKSQILSTVGHELRTPLTSIKGFLELLADSALGPLNETQERCVSQALKNTDMLGELIESILVSARSETSSLRVELRPIDLNVVIKDVAASLEAMLQSAQLTLDLDLPTERSIVTADPLRLNQVLLNLLGNAIKFSRPGGRIAVAVHFFDGGARVSVKDHGIGIPPGVLKNVFDPFFQVDASDTRPYGGMGLGLSISRNLVEAMGGQIHVESELGRGSTFWFTLSLAGTASEGPTSLSSRRHERT